jgi:UDP-N-acetylglucosamine/UDP-N-acetylgalactosamine diphosphorylase
MNPDTLRHPLIEQFAAAGQGGVFAFFDRLDAAQRTGLLAQAAEIDLAEVARLYRTLVAGAGAGAAAGTDLEPPEAVPLPAQGGDAAAWARAEAAGIEALRAGRIAAFTVAGGQGTRLGFDGPKGTFPVTPVRQRPLFQVFAEKILAAGRRAGRPLPWFIMTSHQNHAATEAFFAEHRWFGLDRGRVHFLRQGRMPAVDFSGRILLETPGTIALSPDGHGGSLRALDRSGALDLMRAEGVDTISYFQVDNPLVRVIDPAFLGWHLLAGSEMSNKMVPKTDPAEKVGLFCRSGKKLGVVEYSDLPAAMQAEREPDGRLRFRAANIAVHVLDREFVRRLAGGEGALPFHRADKKIPTVDAAGDPVAPAKPNGVKFELFVFDALPFARNPLLLETSRAEDFSPVKNAAGADSPQTARDDQLRQWARWLRAAGADLSVDATGLPAIALEVSPLFADDERAFAAAWRKLSPSPAIRDGLVLADSP